MATDWSPFFLTALATGCAGSDTEIHKVLIRDVTTVEGVRDNSLVGYGLVVGLKGTGDKQQTYFTVQTLASVLARMGVEIPPTVLQSTVQVKNVAAVLVTATLPPFAPPGMHLDIMVSSVGDARSLEGGTLVLTPLYAADGQVYAAAQGPVVIGRLPGWLRHHLQTGQPSHRRPRSLGRSYRTRQFGQSQQTSSSVALAQRRRLFDRRGCGPRHQPAMVRSRRNRG